MTKNRLEAFSDGVFAIVITLLVLDIKLPEKELSSEKELVGMLFEAIPNIATYAFSFLVVGVFWIAHHRLFAFVKKVDHFLLWSNVFYLMAVALIPYPAAILAKYPLYATSIVIYATNLLMCGLYHFIFLHYLNRNPTVAENFYNKEVAVQAFKLSIIGPICYSSAIIVAFINPIWSFFFLFFALIYYIFLANMISKKIY